MTAFTSHPIKFLPLKLRRFNCLFITDKGAFFITEHDFKIFVPNEILAKIFLIKYKSEQIK
jgi:hypothetical protein